MSGHKRLPHQRLTMDDFHISDYSIWEDFEIEGWPVMTILRGTVAVENGQITAPAGRRPLDLPEGGSGGNQPPDWVAVMRPCVQGRLQIAGCGAKAVASSRFYI